MIEPLAVSKWIRRREDPCTEASIGEPCDVFEVLSRHDYVDFSWLRWKWPKERLTRCRCGGRFDCLVEALSVADMPCNPGGERDHRYECDLVHNPVRAHCLSP